MSLEQEIKGKALELGFDAAGITDASPLGREHMEHFEAWLRSGYAGPMQYMHRNLGKRFDPAKLLDGARSIIVVALSYKPPEDVCSVPVRAYLPGEEDNASRRHYERASRAWQTMRQGIE